MFFYHIELQDVPLHKYTIWSVVLAYSVPAAPLLQVGGLIVVFILIEPSVEELPQVIPPATVTP